MRTVVRTLLLPCLLVLFTASDLRGEDRFYAVIFGVQDRLNRFNEAHTFATFMHVRHEPAQIAIVDQATISWLPTSTIVRLRRRAEPGTNHTLKRSLEDVKPRSCIAQWGPFEIQEELFCRAKKHAHFLDCGGLLYKAVDPRTRPRGVAVNCEHAVLDIGDKGDFPIRTGTAHGHYGSYLVAQHLKCWMIHPHIIHDWLNGPLGLDCYPIQQKGWHR